jgi:hypothetical protein
MNNRRKGLVLFLILVMVAEVAVLAGTANFAPTTYNPAVGEDITFTVCQTCLSYDAVSYNWDFDGDGTYEVSTTEPIIEHAFSEPGFVAVTLRVDEGGGRYATCRKGMLVGESPLFAVRDVAPDESGSILVQVTVSARSEVSAVGLEETVPIGWQWEILDAANAVTKKEGQDLQILWMSPIEVGDSWTVTYRLYPSRGSGSPHLAGAVSGYAESRVKTSVCGDLDIGQ